MTASYFSNKRVLATGACGTMVSKQVDHAYHSVNETPLSHGELLDFLTQNGLLGEDG